MSRTRTQSLLLALAVVAFLGPSVAYVNVVFSPTTRWAFAVLLALAVIGSRRWRAPLVTGPGRIVLFYCAWCLVTALWSMDFELSAMKALAQFLVVVPFTVAGAKWVEHHRAEETLDYLLPTVGIVLFAGVAGQAAATAMGGNDAISLYQGFSNNPNTLGAMVAMVMPCMLWQCYRHDRHKRWRLVGGGVTLVLIVLLAAAGSRGSIMAVLLTLGGMTISLNLRARLRIVLLVVLGATLMAVAIPNLAGHIQQRYIFKTGDHILATRQGPWEVSYEKALQGGWFGAGFGVTTGATSFEGGLSALGYGREKANSQLAVWEETGLVGLSLYSGVIISLISVAWSNVRLSPHRDLRVLNGTIFGALIGFLVASVFEAWWTAPGAPESGWLWPLVGIIIGTRQQLLMYRKRRALVPKYWKPRVPSAGYRYLRTTQR